MVNQVGEGTQDRIEYELEHFPKSDATADHVTVCQSVSKLCALFILLYRFNKIVHRGVADMC